MVSIKPYCTRCQKSFYSSRKRRRHVDTSPRHNICHFCPTGPDFGGYQELNDHLEEEHNVCIHCNGWFSTPSELAHHDVAHHSGCITCRRSSKTRANQNKVCCWSIFLERGDCWSVSLVYGHKGFLRAVRQQKLKRHGADVAKWTVLRFSMPQLLYTVHADYRVSTAYKGRMPLKLNGL